MDQRPGFGRRSRSYASVAVAVVAVLAVLVGGGLWASGTGPFAVSRTPETRYVYPSGGATASAAQSAAPSAAEPIATVTAGIDPATDAPTDPATAGPTATGTAVTEPATAAPTARPTAEVTATPTPTAAPTPFTPATAALARPDLEFSLYTVPIVTCGVRYTMTTGVINSGSVASRATNFLLYDQYPEFNTLASASASVPALAAGASTNFAVSFTVSSGCGQVHNLTLRIDAASVVDESDEENNFLRLTHTVRAPNLYLTDLTVPAHPACGSVTVGVRVNNNGSAAATSGLVRFTDTYSGAPGYSKSVYVSFPNIAAGTSRIVSQTFPALQYCNHTHTITAVIDPGGEILETNDSDNTAVTTYHPDL